MKIVLTGGPSAGKTSVAEIIARQFCKELFLVQEAASLLFRGGFPRSIDDEHQKHQQLAIYYVQRELERIAEREPKHRNLICDRGSLDSLAYWPNDGTSFLAAAETTIEDEVARYDWVLHLDTSSKPAYQTNPLRVETNREALLLNEKIKVAWSEHPRRFIIPSTSDFIPKVNRAIQIIGYILEGSTFDDINSRLPELFEYPSIGMSSPGLGIGKEHHP
jgi:hypothetical protein